MFRQVVGREGMTDPLHMERTEAELEDKNKNVLHQQNVPWYWSLKWSGFHSESAVSALSRYVMNCNNIIVGLLEEVAQWKPYYRLKYIQISTDYKCSCLIRDSGGGCAVLFERIPHSEGYQKIPDNPSRSFISHHWNRTERFISITSPLPHQKIWSNLQSTFHLCILNHTL